MLNPRASSIKGLVGGKVWKRGSGHWASGDLLSSKLPPRGGNVVLLHWSVYPRMQIMFVWQRLHILKAIQLDQITRRLILVFKPIHTWYWTSFTYYSICRVITLMTLTYNIRFFFFGDWSEARYHGFEQPEIILKPRMGSQHGVTPILVDQLQK